MRKILLVALGSTAILSAGPFAGSAAAAVVCGNSGCAPVFTKHVQRPPRNFTLLAAPLNVPTGNQPRKPPANK
jgi:hypothetical protein